MRLIVLAFPLLLMAQPLPLPVRYDPFVSHFSAAKKVGGTKGTLEVKTKQKWHLAAIYGKRAYINGRFVQEGERIGGFRVEKIEEGRVVLVRGGIRKLLYFARPIVRMMERR